MSVPESVFSDRRFSHFCLNPSLSLGQHLLCSLQIPFDGGLHASISSFVWGAFEPAVSKCPNLSPSFLQAEVVASHHVCSTFSNAYTTGLVQRR